MKKRNFLLSILLITGLSVFAQQNSSVQQIPANVKNKFMSTYPNASNVTWEQSGGYFIPVFTNNNAVTKLLLDLKGTLIHTSVQIPATALPAAVSSYISANYVGQNINEADKLTMFNGATRYEVVVGGADMLFDSNGAFIKLASGPLKQ